MAFRIEQIKGGRKLLNLVNSLTTLTGSDPELEMKLKEKGDSIIDLVLKMYNQLQEIAVFAADDFEDEFIVPPITDGNYPTTFTLTHKPVGKINLYIDGIKKYKDTYSYDEEANTITWLATEANNGFDLTDCSIIAEYDYIRKD